MVNGGRFGVFAECGRGEAGKGPEGPPPGTSYEVLAALWFCLGSREGRGRVWEQGRLVKRGEGRRSGSNGAGGIKGEEGGCPGWPRSQACDEVQPARHQRGGRANPPVTVDLFTVPWRHDAASISHCGGPVCPTRSDKAGC